MNRPWLVLILISVPFLLFFAEPTTADMKLPPLEIIVSEVTGQVEVQRAEATSWIALEEKQELYPGDRIRTGGDGTATVSIPGVSVTDVTSQSEIEILTLLRKTEEEATLGGPVNYQTNTIELEAHDGRLINSVREHERTRTNYSIITEDAVAGVRGTVFMLDLTSQKFVTTSVLDGSVNFYPPSSRNRGTVIQADQQSQWRRGQPSPDPPGTLESSTREQLERFKREARSLLNVPPWLGEFQLNGTSFQSSIKIAYESNRELTLSGNAVVQEPDHTLDSVKIDGDFGSRVFRNPDGRESRWTIRHSPEVPGEGEQVTLTVRVVAEDSESVTTRPRVLTIVLVNPAEDSSNIETKKSGSERVTAELRQTLNNDGRLAAAVDVLGEMHGAFETRAVEAYLNPVSPSAQITNQRQTINHARLSTVLSTVMPYLRDLSWEYEIVGYEKRGDRLYLSLDSRYFAQLVEFVGIETKSVNLANHMTSSRVRRVKQLSGESVDRFVFDVSGARPTVVEMTSTFPDREILNWVERAEARRGIKTALFTLFYAFERLDSTSFGNQVHPSFRNDDDNEFHHDAQRFMDSVRADMDHLYSVDYNVRMESIQFLGGPEEARVDISWDRRARLGQSNKLWLIRDQSTTLRFKRGSPYKLYRIHGDPVFGLSSAWTNSTLVSGGTLDGSGFSPRQIDDALTIKQASVEEFPEVDNLDAAGEILCRSGMIETDPVEDATWCENVTVAGNITIPSGITVTVDPATNLTIDGSRSMTVNGTLKMDDVTVSHPSTSKTPGIIFKAGAIGEINQTTFDDADVSIRVDGGDVTVTDSTFKGHDTDDLDGGAKQILAAGGNITIEDSLFQTVGNLGSSTAVRFGGAATLTLNRNTFQGTYQLYVRADNDFTGSLNSTENNYNGGGNTTWGVGNQSSSGGSSVGTMSFNNDVFKNLTRGICIICNGGSGKDLTVTNSDFIDNDQPGIAAPSSIGTVTLDGNYFGGNNTNSCYTTNTSTPDDSATINPQYTGASSVSNPRSSPNRATDPGYGNCGV